MRFGCVCCYVRSRWLRDSQVALYRAADCMIITSVRDGMNLMAYEFVACQKVRTALLCLRTLHLSVSACLQDKAGVLIISEYAPRVSLGAFSIHESTVPFLLGQVCGCFAVAGCRRDQSQPVERQRAGRSRQACARAAVLCSVAAVDSSNQFRLLECRRPSGTSTTAGRSRSALPFSACILTRSVL